MFTWRELMTKDVDRAKGFYGELFGWTFQDADMGDFVYTLIHNGGGREIGGMMPMMDDEHPPHWMGYVSVPDVDAACEAAKKAGGTVPVEPMDIPPGRFAVVGDPSGAYFSVSRWTEGDPELGRPGVGAFCWETLSTSDVDGAFDFYGKVCGWKGANTGPGGMKVFAAGDVPVADPQPVQPGAPPHWLTYVVVPGGADAGRDKAAKLGATVLVPRIEVPEVGTIAIIADPTGAVIGLFEPGAML
jgi:hypothetical protein